MQFAGGAVSVGECTFLLRLFAEAISLGFAMEPAVAMQHRLSLGQPLLVGLGKGGMEALGVTEVTTAAQ